MLAKLEEISDAASSPYIKFERVTIVVKLLRRGIEVSADIGEKSLNLHFLDASGTQLKSPTLMTLPFAIKMFMAIKSTLDIQNECPEDLSENIKNFLTARLLLRPIEVLHEISPLTVLRDNLELVYGLI